MISVRFSLKWNLDPNSCGKNVLTWDGNDQVSGHQLKLARVPGTTRKISELFGIMQ